METPIHSLQDKYMITNVMGQEMHFTAELLAWNSIIMILLTIASLMVMINRMSTEDDTHNRLIKIFFGGLAIVSLAGLFYPIEFGLIGINAMVTIILIVDFFKHKKV